MSDTDSIELCTRDEIPSDSSRGFSAHTTLSTVDVFVVNKDGRFNGYVNSCPHTGAPLEWMPHQFLSLDATEIQCALHGARFKIDSGLCVMGPCVGQSLTAIPIEIKDQQIFWLRDEQYRAKTT